MAKNVTSAATTAQTLDLHIERALVQMVEDALDDVDTQPVGLESTPRWNVPYRNRLRSFARLPGRKKSSTGRAFTRWSARSTCAFR